MERMKKTLMMALLAGCLCAVAPSTAQAQVASDRSANNQERYDDDNDADYGWIGLLGLVGLAGLMKKSREVRDTRYENQPATRSY
jgi:hypothetical protein